MQFDPIAVDCGGSIGGISPRVGVEVNEGEDEGVHEKRDASREASAEVKGRGLDCSPKHYENICNMVHPGSVHVSCFFISRRHEQ